ncbi:MAG: hypothetical protein WAL90_06305 [Desulfobacterales bacterium]
MGAKQRRAPAFYCLRTAVSALPGPFTGGGSAKIASVAAKTRTGASVVLVKVAEEHHPVCLRIDINAKKPRASSRFAFIHRLLQT